MIAVLYQRSVFLFAVIIQGFRRKRELGTVFQCATQEGPKRVSTEERVKEDRVSKFGSVAENGIRMCLN